MRILVLFLDMVRTDHLNLYDKTQKPTSLDDFLISLGGCLYTKCYSPAPDTPRSTACMQTGLLPYKNGCDSRIKWPKYFIKDNLNTIFDLLANEGYTLNLCINQEEYETGFFKFKESNNIKYFPSLEEFVNGRRIEDKEFTFIGFPDFHTAITDYCSTEYSLKKGWEIFKIFKNKYLRPKYIQSYDYIITYSDHGMALSSEISNNKSKLHLLNDNRSRILLHIHKKGDNVTKTDTRLASIVDIYTTIASIVGITEKRDGFDLLSFPGREILHIEDHTDFSVSPEVIVKQWRVITKDFDIRTDLINTIDESGEKEDLNKILPYLQENSPKISDLKRQYEVWERYKLINTYRPNYFVGTPRLNSFAHKMLRFIIKIYNKTLNT